MYLVVDYRRVKAGTAGAELSISVPFEELFVPEGEAVFPIRSTFDRALEGFTEAKLPEIVGLEIPFSPLSVDTTPSKRHRYITLNRLIKYGGTPGCKACKGESTVHNPVCKVRFDGLIRADKAADARLKESKAPPTPKPETLLAPPPEDDLPSFAELFGHEPGDLVPEGEANTPAHEHVPDTTGALASLVRIRTELDDDFIERDYKLRKGEYRGNESKRQIIEYCCDEDSEIGFSAETHGVAFLRLGENTLDLANAEHVEQVKGQVNTGDSLWFSIPCTQHTHWQRINVHRHGSQYKARLKKRQARVREMLRLAIGLAEYAIEVGCHVVFEWPQSSGLWLEPLWVEFEERCSLRRCYFDGCASGVGGINTSSESGE